MWRLWEEPEEADMKLGPEHIGSTESDGRGKII